MSRIIRRPYPFVAEQALYRRFVRVAPRPIVRAVDRLIDAELRLPSVSCSGRNPLLPIPRGTQAAVM